MSLMNNDNEESKILKPILIHSKSHSFFKTYPEKGIPYFFKAKVGSCSYIILKKGKCLAIPFTIRTLNGRKLSNFNSFQKKLTTSKSTYMYDYLPRVNVHCGMRKKPLVPYNMNSLRSQLPLDSMISGTINNRSSLELGEPKLINSKQWNSTYKETFRKFSNMPIFNFAVASMRAKARHLRQGSI